MTRGTGMFWGLGLLAVCATGCGDSFEEGRAKALPNGLKIIDVKDGSGDPLSDGDSVEIQYTGWLKESPGTPFDSSLASGRSLKVMLGKGDVVQGLEMGMEGMKPGGTRRIFIPSHLGFRERGRGRDIPPNADLVYQVEVVKVLERAREVKTTDLKEGSGPAVKKGDRVSVHYTGWLTDGTKFDSSLDKGEPFSLTVGAGGVIKGWDKGLLGAKAGGKRRLEIPAALGYGARGSPGGIPPNADLVFEIEVLTVTPGR